MSCNCPLWSLVCGEKRKRANLSENGDGKDMGTERQKGQTEDLCMQQFQVHP